jgi:hypothetical protein
MVAYQQTRVGAMIRVPVGEGECSRPCRSRLFHVMFASQSGWGSPITAVLADDSY